MPIWVDPVPPHLVEQVDGDARPRATGVPANEEVVEERVRARNLVEQAVRVQQVPGRRHRGEAEDLREHQGVVVEVGAKGAGVDLREAPHGEAGVGEGSQSGREAEWCLGSALLPRLNHG